MSRFVAYAGPKADQIADILKTMQVGPCIYCGQPVTEADSWGAIGELDAYPPRTTLDCPGCGGSLCDNCDQAGCRMCLMTWEKQKKRNYRPALGPS